MIYLFDRQKKLQKIIPKKHLLSAIQTVELNGLYQLSVEVPLFYETKEGTKYNHKKNVERAWFVGHYDRQKRFQLYKIHSRKVRAEAKQTLVFDGVHIFFDEAKAMGNIHDRRFRDSEMKPAADAAFNPIGWYVKDYDMTGRADITFYRDSVANARSLIIEKFGVEFDYGLTFDGRKIISKDLYIKKRLGKWTGKRFAYGTNLLSLTQEQDESEVYTAAVGRGKGEESGDGYGPRLEFGDIEWSKDGITKPIGQNWIEIPSATAEYGYYENGEIHPRIASEVVFENTENKQLLADSTYYWLLENCVPKALWKTDVAKADVHNLGDGVGVIYKKANIIKKARVHKMENNLLDHRLSKIILGDYQHFKTDKRQQSITAQLKRNRRDSQSYITQLKNDFDVRYDAQATAIENAYQQAVIDAQAEVQAAESRMQTEINTQRTEIETAIETSRTNAINAATEYSDALEEQLTQDITTQRTELLGAIDTARTEAINQAELDAEEKAGQVQSNLNTFKGEHEALYNEVVGNINEIDTFLGDKSQTLAKQFADMESGLNQSINVESGRIDAIVTNFGDTGKTLSQFAMDVNSIETTVAGHDEWFGTYGSAAEQTIAGFERKAWLDDIVNPNLLSHTDITKVENRRQWTGFNTSVTGLTYGEYMRVRNTVAGSALGIRSPDLALVEGEQYTLSFTAFVENASVSEHFNYCYVFSPLGNYKVNNPTFTVVETPTGSYGGNTVRQYKLTFTAARNEEQAQIMIGSRTTETGIDASFAFKHPKLEMDTRATAYHTSFMSIEERADLIRLQVQDIEGDYVKQSGVEVMSDRVLIGSTSLGTSTIASILAVSPTSIDIITNELNLSGNANVKGQIESLAVSAVTADFAEIFADVADIGFIKGNHIETNSINVDHLTGADAILGLLMARTVFSDEVKTLSIEAAKANFGDIVAGTADIGFIKGAHIDADSITVDKLSGADAILNYLMARTIFSNEVKALSINAVHADLTSVTSEIMTTNILKSEWLKVDTALFERFTANEAFIDRLVVKAANVRDLEAITIDAVQANLTTVMNSMGEVEGGLTIRRPDGALFIENGLQKFGQPIQLVEYRSDGVEWNGQTYDTSRRGTQIFQTAYTDHSGRYANFTFRVGLRWDSPSASDHIAVLVRPDNVPSGVSLQNYYEERTIVYRDSGLKSLTINVPLPRPTYGALSFTLEFYNVATINQGSIVQVRPTRAWISA